MATLKIACWNVYFSHNLVKRVSGKWRVNQESRSDRVAEIIEEIDADVIGWVECMSPAGLRFFRDEFLPGYEFITEGTESKLNIGLLYKPDRVAVEKLTIPKGSWKANIGLGGRKETYHFSRVPLAAEITDLDTGNSIAHSVVHAKSKKNYSGTIGEDFENRRKIIAQTLRIRHIMKLIAKRDPSYERFVVAGDVNDGPGFDEFEAKINISGIESLIGTVLKPEEIYYSFVDLSDGGIPTTPFHNAPQLDHILYSQELLKSGGPKTVKNSGKVRTDLVNFKKGSGKAKDSDHAPVEMKVRF